ncbi:Transposase, Ptta/En/Spm, plant [Corchorus olitorius]|uniref:Transposase, Ptta/En/Spm, plant n=1 Tax=Corchorus olitorius TaxID=93759 RepID=A0A1R3HFP9_9ROSI|nr:Transposase, Ptta/En/Spm, plant [Corchorus olitorius]
MASSSKASAPPIALFLAFNLVFCTFVSSQFPFIPFIHPLFGSLKNFVLFRRFIDLMVTFAKLSDMQTAPWPSVSRLNKDDVSDELNTLAMGPLKIAKRNTEAAPLNYDRWDLMPQSFKDKQYSLLKVIKILCLVLFEPFNVNLALFSLEKYFELPEVLGPWINASIGRNWRDYKGELKAKYYDEMLPIAENIANLPPDVPIHQWIHLVNYFESAKAKKFAELGRQGRKCQKAPHTIGSKSFARKKYEMVQENEKPIGAVAFYFATHQHKNGNLVDDEASSVMEKAMKELTDMNVSIDSTSENDISLQQVAMSRVRGKEHSGRVRGLGLGPTPTQVFGSSRFSANPFGQPSQEVTRLKNKVVDLESEVAQIPELKSQVATITLLEARIDSMMMIIQKHLPYIDILMQPQVGNNTNENVTNPSMPSQTSTHHQGETCKRARKF